MRVATAGTVRELTATVPNDGLFHSLKAVQAEFGQELTPNGAIMLRTAGTVARQSAGGGQAGGSREGQRLLATVSEMDKRGRAIQVHFRLLIAGAVTGLALLALLARMLLWEAGFLGVLVALTPYFVPASLLAAGLAAWGSHVKTAIAAALAMLLCLSTQVPLFVADAGHTPGAMLRVATLNTRFGQADEREILQLVRDQNIDVLMLQEFPLEEAADLGQLGLGRVLPHRYLVSARGASGTGIWSRWPMGETRQLEGYASPNIVATVDVPDVGPVTFAAVHPGPPGSTVGDNHAAEQRLLLMQLGAMPGTLVMGGDFSATVDQAPLRRLMRARFEDAAEQSGSGLHLTWPQNSYLRPVLGVDHVLTRGGLRATQVQAYPILGADHRAVVATLTVAR